VFAAEALAAAGMWDASGAGLPAPGPEAPLVASKDRDAS